MTTNLINLEKKVSAMLEGEKKRREVAEKFLERLEDILQPIAEDVWGMGTSDQYGSKTRAVFIKNKNKEGKNFDTHIYYRYSEFKGHDGYEWNGFYLLLDAEYTEFPLHGSELINIRGSEFWDGIRCIINWLPILIETIENRNNSRDQLLALINVK